MWTTGVQGFDTLPYLGRGGVYELQLLRTALWAPHPLALRCHGSLDFCARHGNKRSCRHSRTQPYIIRATCWNLGNWILCVYIYICICICIYVYPWYIYIYTYIQIFGVRQCKTVRIVFRPLKASFPNCEGADKRIARCFIVIARCLTMFHFSMHSTHCHPICCIAVVSWPIETHNAGLWEDRRSMVLLLRAVKLAVLGCMAVRVVGASEIIGFRGLTGKLERTWHNMTLNQFAHPICSGWGQLGRAAVWQEWRSFASVLRGTGGISWKEETAAVSRGYQFNVVDLIVNHPQAFCFFLKIFKDGFTALYQRTDQLR